MKNHIFDAVRKANSDRSRIFAETEDGKVHTYGDVFDMSAKIANHLEALGVRPGDRVATYVGKSVEALYLYLGCLRAGAAYLPLNTAYTPAELEYFLEDAEPSLFVCAPEAVNVVSSIADNASLHVETLDELGGGTLLEQARGASPARRDANCGPSDLAAILYTSGTTGRSKGAMLTHDNLLSNAATLKNYWRFSERDRLLHALPIFHAHGLFVATNTTLLSGASMLMMTKFDADRVIELMPRATVMMGVPTHYVRLARHPGLDRKSTDSIRLFISGSAPLLVETHQTFQDRTGHVILERYGMTETVMITSNPYEGDRIAGTVGFPLPDVELRVTDMESGIELPANQTGMIEVRGPNVFSGYWRMPEKTRQEFRPDGFFVTGDLGLINDRGYVSLVGRGKDLIISGGFNVYPKEIEEEIDSIDGVVESAVIGIPHPDFGEGVTAIVSRDPHHTVNAELITDILATRLANYKRPKRIIFVDELPRNTMGKVQKNVLREEYRNIY